MISQNTFDSKYILHLNLDGEDGNIFNLIGYVSKLGRNLGLTGEERKTIIDEMMAKDYLNALLVFDKNFGKHVNLITNNPNYFSLYNPENNENNENN